MAVTSEDVAAAAVGQKMTLDEFLALPGTKPALELDGGRVTQKAAPQGQHLTLQYELTQRVNALAQPSKLAKAYSELRATYAGLSRVPDVSVYLWERIPRVANGCIGDRFTEPPDLAVEIVSPDQFPTDLFDECTWYVNHGVKIALVVDPDQDVVFRFRPNALPDVLRGNDQIDLDEVLPGFELPVAQSFESLLD